MSGALQALIGSSAENLASFSLTVANGSGVGFIHASLGGGQGAISPASFRGDSVAFARSIPGVGVGKRDFQFGVLNNARTQNRLDRIVVADGDGNPRIFRAAEAAAFVNDASTSHWQWGDGTDPVYDAGDDTEVHTMRVYWKV